MMTNFIRRSLFLLVLALSCSRLSAQAWSGILNTDRAIDWSASGTNPGVNGGIPTRSTVCVTRNPGVTSATLNADLADATCANKVVLLTAGAYSLTNGLVISG